jgi:outer membrane murein-binding lipoprotein Lpp
LKLAAVISAAVLLGAGCSSSANLNVQPPAASGDINATVPAGSAGGSYNQ